MFWLYFFRDSKFDLFLIKKQIKFAVSKDLSTNISKNDVVSGMKITSNQYNQVIIW